jgi:hypothetical protein
LTAFLLDKSSEKFCEKFWKSVPIATYSLLNDQLNVVGKKFTLKNLKAVAFFLDFLV